MKGKTKLIKYKYFQGGILGATVALPLFGILSCSPMGWPSIFYLSSTQVFFWVLMWCLFGADSPATHPKISIAERQFIETNLPHSSQEKVIEKKIKIITYTENEFRIYLNLFMTFNKFIYLKCTGFEDTMEGYFDFNSSICPTMCTLG